MTANRSKEAAAMKIEMNLLEQRDTEADLAKLADAFFVALERESRCEYGGWGLDDKRPFGNSYVQGDILEIIGMEPESDDGYSDEQENYADDLYGGLGEYLQRRWAEMRKPEAA